MAMRYLGHRDVGDLLVAALRAGGVRLRRPRRPDRALAPDVVGARPRARFARRRHLLRRRARHARVRVRDDGGWDAVIFVYFVCCGVSRLARYNVTAESLSGRAAR
jgi:hypothetical protein